MFKNYPSKEAQKLKATLVQIIILINKHNQSNSNKWKKHVCELSYSKRNELKSNIYKIEKKKQDNK